VVDERVCVRITIYVEWTIFLGGMVLAFILTLLFDIAEGVLLILRSLNWCLTVPDRQGLVSGLHFPFSPLSALMSSSSPDGGSEDGRELLPLLSLFNISTEKSGFPYPTTLALS
jgi:hypothetical protein